MMPPFVVFPTNRIAHFVEVSLYLFYLAQQVNLATRIYETRNALVHSKSEQITNQYRPYENKKELMLEIVLIRSVVELVIINSSEIL